VVVGKLKLANADPFQALGQQLNQAVKSQTKPAHLAPPDLKKAKAGLIDAPPSPIVTPKAKVTGVTKLPPPFKSFMKIDAFDVTIERPGAAAEVQRVSALRGKGDNCTMVVPVFLDEQGMPSFLLKDGNTRAAQEMRQPGSYRSKKGMVGGRWDKDVGADPAGIAKKIGIAELAEEVGARAMKGGAFVLGERLMATMPGQSTEADLPVVALSAFVEGDKITGDQSGMEVVGLMKPVLLSFEAAFAEARSGEISEGPRFATYARRSLDQFGFIPELKAYVFDLPPALKSAFKQNGTLGLGDPVDPRKIIATGEYESAEEIAHAPDPNKAKPKVNPADINGVEFITTKRVEVEGFGTMFDALTDHVVKHDGKADRADLTHPNQITHFDFDLAKVAVYYEDKVQGPMVRLAEVERPIFPAKGQDDEVAYKNEHYDLVRRDLPEVQVDLPFEGLKTPEEIIKKASEIDIPKIAETAVKKALDAGGVKATLAPLGAPGFASPGGADLQHHFFAAKLSAPPASTEGFVRLSDAIRVMRGGEGDPAAEEGLLRLAAATGWIPSLGMSIAMAKTHLSKFADDE